MKYTRLFIFSVLFFSSLCVLFAQKDIIAISKIKKINVYLSSAQIERSAIVNLPAGSSDIIISGLSQYLDVQSMRVSGKGDFIILSQQVQKVYPEPQLMENIIPPAIQKQLKALVDSIENINYDIQENQLRREVFQFEKNTLQNSKAITGTDTLPFLKDGLAFYRTKMLEINTELLRIDKKTKHMQKQKVDMDQRLNALQNYIKSFETNKAEQMPESVLRLSIIADKAVPNASLEFSYLTSNVSWEPLYELKVDDVSKPVQLTLKANLTQNTGELWDNAKLVFSTGRPTAYKKLPVLNVWYLNYNMQRTAQTSNVYMNESAPAMAKEGGAIVSDEVLDYRQNYVQMNQNLLFAEYEVQLPYTIKSDGKPQIISLLNTQLQASYKYMAIPKMDKEAFLTAYLEGWEKLSLIQGKTNVIYNNSIISQTIINPSVVDTLIVSLGVDKRVTLERKKISDKSKDRIVGNTRERTIHMEITVKNQNQSEIQLVLKDQIPVSRAQDIKVSLEERSNAKHNEHTGELEWYLTLQANETRRVEFRYTIKFDSSKSLLTE